MIFIHRYCHRSQGVLVKAELNGACGFGNIHPWATLGDRLLEEEIRALQKGVIREPLLTHLREDASARREGRSLTCNISSRCHFFLADRAVDLKKVQARGFSRVKVKNPNVDQLFSLPKGMLWRIDFNESLSDESFDEFLAKAPLDKIDYIEDPVPFDQKKWERWQKKVPLACDREALVARDCPDAASVLIIKPMRVDPHAFIGLKQRIVVTDLLDHPVGQMHALRSAHVLCPDECSGIASHLALPANDFSCRLKMEGDRLFGTHGCGIGFDDILEGLLWERIY